MSKRIHELDALRGLALLGILLVNSFVFHAPYCYYGEFYGIMEGTQATVVDMVENFAAGKFLFIFAFLFGYGITLQQQSHQAAFKGYFVKRMLVLLLFGLLHILLFWFGDVLTSYALLGLLILPFIQWSDRKILLLGILFIAFRPLYYFGVVGFGWPLLPPAQPVELQEFLTTFQEGSYWEIFKLRIAEFIAFIPENLIWYIPKTFGIFFIGIYTARKQLFDNIQTNTRLYLVIALSLLISSLIWNHYKMHVFGLVDLKTIPIWRPILIGINISFETALSMGYIFGFTILFQKIPFITSILAKAGRLALTNYIMQSLICVFIFYGYGFGFYGKLQPTDLILITLGIFGWNIIFSSIYLNFQTIGPLEMLWRKLIDKH